MILLMCDINAVLLVISLNKKLYPECRLPLLVFNLISKSSCDNCNDKGIIRKFESCSSTKLWRKMFNIKSTSDNDATTSLRNGSNE